MDHDSWLMVEGGRKNANDLHDRTVNVIKWTESSFRKHFTKLHLEFEEI